MSALDALGSRLSRAAEAVVAQMADSLPQWLTALGLVVLGWIVARLAQALVRRAAGAIDRWRSQRPGRSGTGVRPAAPLLARGAFWVVLLFFVTAATHALGLDTFTAWLARLLDQVPAVLVGLLIVGAGYLLSTLVAGAVEGSATGLAPPQRRLLARAAQVATLAVALLVGAEQMGLKLTWLAVLAAVLLAVGLGGVAVAVALGARGYVANAIGAHHLRQALRPGQRVQLAGHEGRIVEITATSLVLEGDRGRVLLPGRVYNDEAIVVIARADADGG